MLYVTGISRKELESLAEDMDRPPGIMDQDHWIIYEAGVTAGKAMLARRILEGCCGELDKVE